MPLQPWGCGGAREEKGRIYQPQPLLPFTVGTQPLLHSWNLPSHFNLGGWGGAREEKARIYQPHMHHPNLSHSTCKSSSTAHGTTEFIFATTAAKSREKHQSLHVQNVASFLIEPALRPRMQQSQQLTATSDLFFIPWHQGHPLTATSDNFFFRRKRLKAETRECRHKQLGLEMLHLPACYAKTSITCGSKKNHLRQ